MTDITDINPIVNVGTDKNPIYVLDATWMTVLHDLYRWPAIDGYVEFTDRFVKEYNEGGFDTTLAIKRMM